MILSCDQPINDTEFETSSQLEISNYTKKIVSTKLIIM